MTRRSHRAAVAADLGRYAMTKMAKKARMKEKKVDGRELLILSYEVPPQD